MLFEFFVSVFFNGLLLQMSMCSALWYVHSDPLVFLCFWRFISNCLQSVKNVFVSPMLFWRAISSANSAAIVIAARSVCTSLAYLWQTYHVFAVVKENATSCSLWGFWSAKISIWFSTVVSFKPTSVLRRVCWRLLIPPLSTYFKVWIPFWNFWTKQNLSFAWSKSSLALVLIRILVSFSWWSCYWKCALYTSFLILDEDSWHLTRP